MTEILEKYPTPWRIVKVERMNYYRIESSDNQYIMWGDDIEILEFIVYLANKQFHHIPVQVVKDIIENQVE